jgi:hypothetical protein
VNELPELPDHPYRTDVHLAVAGRAASRRQEWSPTPPRPRSHQGSGGYDEVPEPAGWRAAPGPAIGPSQMSPGDFFPSSLRMLGAIELAVLHSRAQRAVDAATDHGTLDQEIAFRLEELREELDLRDAEHAHQLSWVDVGSGRSRVAQSGRRQLVAAINRVAARAVLLAIVSVARPGVRKRPQRRPDGFGTP